MAGTLRINESSSWLPAGWVFDGAMEDIAQCVACDAPELARELLDARTDVTIGYLDLRRRDSTTIRRLLAGLQQTIQRVREQGPKSFGQPEFFPGYVAQLEKFRALLLEDARTT